MSDSIINRVNVWGNKINLEVYYNVIKFKNRRKNPYHWDYEGDLDGLLEQKKPHETDPIPSELLGVEFDAEEADGTATYQEVENDNTMDDGASANTGIVHGTPQTDSMEGTVPPPLAAVANNDNIKDVNTLEYETAEIFDVEADDETDGDQEYSTDKNPGDNPYQNQDDVSNTEDVTAATSAKDTTKYHAAEDNPKGSIKVEYTEN